MLIEMKHEVFTLVLGHESHLDLKGSELIIEEIHEDLMLKESEEGWHFRVNREVSIPFIEEIQEMFLS
jgi:hypothetical protein